MSKLDEIIELAEMQKKSLGFIDINKIAESTRSDKDYIRHALNERGMR